MRWKYPMTPAAGEAPRRPAPVPAADAARERRDVSHSRVLQLMFLQASLNTALPY